MQVKRQLGGHCLRNAQGRTVIKDMRKDSIGVIHGRFQGLHNGHMEYLLAGKSRCEHLVIGITNYLCNSKNAKISKIDTHRLTEEANPFTYYERMEMIRYAMHEYDVSDSEFSIVPFPIEQTDLLFNFVPRKAVYYMTIYDDWGREKLQLLTNLELNVKVMWERTEAEKPISGTLIRKKILNGEDYKQFVPESVYNYINAHGLESVIKNAEHKND